MEEYLILDTSNGLVSAFLVTDENGDVMVFTNRNDAEEFIEENLNEGIIVENI